jgi:hypothetical protein
MVTKRSCSDAPCSVGSYPLDQHCIAEFSLPDLVGRLHIFKIYARSMSVGRDIRFVLLARLCPNSTCNSDFLILDFLSS